MSEKEQWVDELLNDPKVLASIRQGMYECHLGRMFSHKLVFGSLKGTGGWFYKRWCFRLVINLKKLWWCLETPYQNYQHRDCAYCAKFKAEVAI